MGVGVYGDPCRECGFSWDIDSSVSRELVRELPARLTRLLVDATGGERHPDLTWPVVSYVAHVGDNLRIWAERLAGIAVGGPAVVAPYDENDLARARAYDSVVLEGALWSLERSVRDWLDATAMAPAELTVIHPERGLLGLGDVILGNTHDALQHEWDIKRSLARSVS